MIKAVKIVNVLNSLSIERTFKIDSNIERTYKKFLMLMLITHAYWMSNLLFTRENRVY